MESQLLERYQKEVVSALQKELGCKNVMQVPRLEKICINVGMGSYLQRGGGKDYSKIEDNIRLITGQKPVVRRARMSVSNFKLREGMPVGISVTLRGKAAYNFLDKTINLVFPRVRGFRGVNRNIFDKQGNCSFGFNDYTVFPEALPDDTGRPFGLQVTVVTTAQNPEGCQKLLEQFKFPFKPLNDDN